MNSGALYKDIGKFFAEHGLWPSPQNYALIYQLFADADSPAAQAVKAATSDGIRLSQRDANEIMDAHGMPGAKAGPDAAVGAALLAATRRQVDEFTAIVEASQAEAKSYGEDLEAGARKLAETGDGGQVATLIGITRTMVERTRAAEQQLNAARSEADTLRSQLAEVAEEARSDPLTHLPNRRAFEERLAELDKAGTPISLAICDVDKFKRINDTYGHGVGDRVLRSVAGLLRECCNGHMVARLGGEEFVILFEKLEPGEAAAIVDEARETLADKKFRLRESDAPIGQVTFSAGVARGAHPAGTPALQRADELLYMAKDGGRNQVRVEP